MKIITDYEVDGCWTTKKAQSKCGSCGSLFELVPETGHFNSQY